MGINSRSAHQPDLLVSCNRRTSTAREGSRNIRLMISETTRLKIAMITVTTKQNKANHQYSDRVARPVKSTYFVRQVLTEV